MKQPIWFKYAEFFCEFCGNYFSIGRSNLQIISKNDGKVTVFMDIECPRCNNKNNVLLENHKAAETV